MTETLQPLSEIIHLRSAGEPDWKPALSVAYQFAPEKAAPGLAGADAGDVLLFPREAGAYAAIVSLGKPGKATLETLRRASGLLGKWILGSGAGELAIELDTLQSAFPDVSMLELAETALVGITLGAYRFESYKQNPAPTQPVTLGLLSGGRAFYNSDFAQRVAAITNAVVFARNLSHEPANVINPVSLAERAQEVAQQAGLKIRVLDDKQLAEMGAGAILAVGCGSQTPPRMIILEYPGTSTDAKPVVLVGKAITFDTGGYSIKSTEGIVGMKYDKCGGVDVLAIMQAAAALKLATPLVGIISAAENMISGGSYRPDDIITTLSGKTVEIVSTDAEGRLVLADALTLAQRDYHPRAIIDMATLTGGVVVALGMVRAGLLSNDDALASDLFSAGEKTYERLWRLPLDEEFSKAMKGDDADLKNSGGRQGHCILGGAFLKEFVADDIPWAHLDIAGMAESDKNLPYAPKGATGFGIRLLLEYLEQLS